MTTSGEGPLEEPPTGPIDLNDGDETQHQDTSDTSSPATEANSESGEETVQKASHRLPYIGKGSARALLVMVILSLSFVPFKQSSYVLVQPGPVFSVDLRSSNNDDPAVKNGTWSFTTISVKRLNWLELTLEQLRNPADVFPSSGASGGSSASAEMSAAKLTAAAVADFLLFNLSTPTSWMVTSVIEGSTAERMGLLENDRIMKANGETLRSVALLRQILRQGSVTLTILRGSESIDINVNVPNNEILGVQLTPIGLPQRVDGDAIRTEDVGGGSAGLMFTLALLDHNSSGDLSGGRRIAGTGTINPDGTVGPIIGVTYKYRAAVQSGANVFFVPSSLADELPNKSDIQIVPVDDVADAVLWLCANGGNSPELCGR